MQREYQEFVKRQGVPPQPQQNQIKPASAENQLRP